MFAVSAKTASDYIHKLKFDKKRVVAVPGGVNYSQIRAIANSKPKKVYDAIYLKRLHPMKGALDLIEIWHRVVSKRPSAKLLIVGDGSKAFVRSMRQKIMKYNLIDNIEIIGPVYDIKEKISLLAKSKLFILPSYEENWAIVIGEALAVGIPVIAYYLPEISYIWGNNVLWVRKGDINSFVDKIIELLLNDIVYGRFSGIGVEFMKQKDWNVIAEEELRIVNRLVLSERQDSC
jgi:glycosyltransferase involved in cell wall biosynthesis